MCPSRRALAATDERFGELYEARHVVAGFVRRSTRDASHVDDLVHETFVVAWRRLPDVPPMPDAVGWLCGVARRVMLNDERSSRRRTALHERYAHTAALTHPPAATAEAVDMVDAWRRLPDRDRSLLVLAGWHGADRDELAHILGCSAEAAAMRLSRARTRLRAELAT
jgi:RNA polymerase sigma-70 factor (ECF subfamily)